jgi:UDP-glucose 4-epimerase
MTNPPLILVTGGAGYIGSHVVLALLDAGRSVVVLDDLSTGRREAVDARAAFVQGDVRDARRLRALLRQGVRGVVHLAGAISAPESVRAPATYYATNVCGTIAVADACVSEGVQTLLFSSTAAVYGAGVDGQLVDETAPTSPVNPYGASKLMGEQVLRDVARAHGLRVCAVRFFNVAGADPAGRAGQRAAGAGNLMKVALEAAGGERAFVPIYGDDYPTPDGTGVRDYLHVSDLASALVLLTDGLLDSAPIDPVLNCGYGVGYSVRQVIAATEKISGRRLAVEMRPRRPGDVASMVADSRRLRGLGWTPEYAELNAMVGDAWRWECDWRARLGAGDRRSARQAAPSTHDRANP